MKRDFHRWRSPALGREMDLLVFGHGGMRVLAFPTSMGRYFDWEDHRMLEPIRHHLDQGRLQMTCVDSVDAESWYAAAAHPSDRVRRHLQYDEYLLNEVIPLTLALSPASPLILTGASFGAFHAVNFALRHPEAVHRVLAMSGFYDIKNLDAVDSDPNWPSGYTDENVYRNNPCDYLLDQQTPIAVELVLVTGRKDRGAANNEGFSSLLHAMGVPHQLHLWEGVCHDWTFWRRWLEMYLRP